MCFPAVREQPARAVLAGLSGADPSGAEAAVAGPGVPPPEPGGKGPPPSRVRSSAAAHLGAAHLEGRVEGLPVLELAQQLVMLGEAGGPLAGQEQGPSRGRRVVAPQEVAVRARLQPCPAVSTTPRGERGRGTREAQQEPSFKADSSVSHSL
jgi:hypothetical protein